MAQWLQVMFAVGCCFCGLALVIAFVRCEQSAIPKMVASMFRRGEEQ